MGTGNLKPGRLLESLFTGKIMGELYPGFYKNNDTRPRVMFPFKRAREKGGGDGGGNDALCRLCYGTRKIYSGVTVHLLGFISTVQHSLLIFLFVLCFLL